MDKTKIYFPNLNGLRLIAALMVIIHHAELSKAALNVSNYSSLPFFFVVGKLGVVLFFVLSGFLITYLLLAEEHLKGTFNIKQFYLRRILRIWPLYFLVIIMAVIIFPNIHCLMIPGFEKDITYSNLFNKIILFILFLPNLLYAIYGVFPFAAHTWSIGTEEQFYLGWPILLRLTKKKRIILMFFIIAIYLFIKAILSSHLSDTIPYKPVIYSFWISFNIDCMAIGGIFALILFNNSKLLKVLMNQFLFYTTILILLLLIIKGIIIPYIHYEFYAFLFGIVILNFAANKKSLISLENNILNYLGKISYGIYMYHPICMFLTIKTLYYFRLYNNYSMIFTSIILTIIIASISYYFYEFKFIKIKSKFSNIINVDCA